MAYLRDIVAFLDSHLDVSSFPDVALNGLQVEGRAEVKKLALGVSSSRRLFEQAVSWGADAVLVHHGLFWGGPRPIVGMLARRLRVLLESQISLLAYHIPLDAHPADGNNAVMAAGLDLRDVEPWGEYRGRKIGIIGDLDRPTPLDEVLEVVRSFISEHPVILGQRSAEISRVAICSGSASGMVEQAIDAGADLFLTGEPGEPAQELAIEGDVIVVGAGHYATERFGVTALGERLAAEFDITPKFIDIPNPV